MALAAQQQAHANWGRWPQQIPPQNFPIMGSPGFMPYDPRAQAGGHMQRQVSSQYLMDSNYSQSPASTVSSPHYQNPGAFSYVPYQSPPPSTPLGSPFKTEFHEHPATRIASSAVDRHSSQPTREYQPYSPVSRKASVSSVAAKPSAIHGPIAPGPVTPGPVTPGYAAPSLSSTSSIAPSPSVAGHLVSSKTLTYNEAINPAERINFKTDIDELMKAIQRSQTKEECQQTLTPAQTPKDVASGSPVLLTQRGKPRKQWFCDGPNCGKAFIQKTHRDIHQRTHTGQRPYLVQVCDKDNCGLTFSQRGNLKCFAQQGNLRSHQETHKGLKPFICRLDNCHKTFSQLGNMKTHQNNYHKPTLQKLTAMFLQFPEHGDVPETYHELFEYFHKHYKNSNKGIKGRGKTRAVASRRFQDAAFRSDPSPVPALAKPPVAAQLPQMPAPAQNQVTATGRPLPYEINQGSANTLSNVLRNPNPSYGLYGTGSPQAMYEMALTKWGSQTSYVKNH
ncbi:hypothetical protein Trco_001201 [Trichoderma cornu-damae]|uniref:C2H2-type domain-containing protein n=1 Tax=Trichoderma cornu-damae TaxID=654480 RepID=A0A9P8TX24_9HYPO|nr:hypothetical protein Trco_001201 [Trichoderma cornu-damae]